MRRLRAIVRLNKTSRATFELRNGLLVLVDESQQERRDAAEDRKRVEHGKSDE